MAGTAGRGRPKGVKNRVTVECKVWALQTSPAARARLARMVESEDDEVAFKACQLILAYAHGKPQQTIEAGPALTKMIIAWAGDDD